MIRKIADNIISPLGFCTETCYKAVRQGESQLRLYEGKWQLPEPFVASLINDEQLEEAYTHLNHAPLGVTRFEKMVLLSAEKAIAESGIDTSSERVVFILSTTKGNVSLLEHSDVDPETVSLGHSANVLTRYFHNPNTPIVVSNACISGVCAQIEAMRCLQSGRYDYAVVVGADEQSKFIVSGFQSFKALSDEPCRPFSKSRNGLNLGEAAATIILQRIDNAQGWCLINGAIRNDANHISGPSRTGEGYYRALRSVMGGNATNTLACINVHGTATAYNDEMEAIAIERAGLIDVPVVGLKGYFGHTMGAAGVLETILTMRSLDNSLLLATRGFDELGVSRPVKVQNQVASTNKKAFIKALSGFGGSNAVLLYNKV